MNMSRGLPVNVNVPTIEINGDDNDELSASDMIALEAAARSFPVEDFDASFAIGLNDSSNNGVGKDDSNFEFQEQMLDKPPTYFRRQLFGGRRQRTTLRRNHSAPDPCSDAHDLHTAKQASEDDYGYETAVPDTKSEVDYGYEEAVPDRAAPRRERSRCINRRSSCGMLEDRTSGDMPIRKPQRRVMRRCSMDTISFEERFTIQRTMSSLGGFSSSDAERKAHQRRRGSKLASLSCSNHSSSSDQADILMSPRGQRQRRRSSLGMVDCEMDDVTLVVRPDMSEKDLLTSPRAKHHQRRRGSLGYEAVSIADNRVLPATEEMSTSVHLKRRPPPRRSSMGLDITSSRSPPPRQDSLMGSIQEAKHRVRRSSMGMVQDDLDRLAQAKEEMTSRSFHSQDDNPPSPPQRRSAVAA